jgi:DNA-directed RNA polymerase specialized sigma24 family protein
VTLEVFTAALEQANLSALTERQQLVWLRRVAHNTLADRYRRSMHLSGIPLEQVKETERTEEALTTEQMVLRGEELERLYKAASTLSLFEQQVL